MTHNSSSLAHVPLSPGEGHIHCTPTSLSTLVYKYPLKLISPYPSLCYILSYGGGIVGGDRVEITAQIDKNATLTLLTQGTTKIFKSSSLISKQTINAKVHGTLLLLPDPVQPFKDSSYIQVQQFQVHGRLLLLDWVVSGRYEEDWLLSSYVSQNEIYSNGRLAVRDVLRLDSSAKQSMGLFRCFATAIMFGFPEIEARCLHLYMTENKVRKNSSVERFWSANQVRGCTIIKAAGRDTEIVKSLLRKLFEGLETVGGRDCLRPFE